MWYEHSNVEVWRNVLLGEVNLNFIMGLVYLWFVYYTCALKRLTS